MDAQKTKSKKKRKQNMKKILSVLCLLASTFGAWAIQQDLSFLTNHAGYVSYAAQQVQDISVQAWGETSPNPYGNPPVWVHHSGDPTVQSFAQTAGAVQFDVSVADTNGYICVTALLYGPHYTNQPYTPLFTAGTCGKPIYDVDSGVWRLPIENSQPEIYVAGRILIRAPGISYAALISTNRWGGYSSRSLQMDYENEGFWFEDGMCGQGKLVVSGWEQDEGGNYHYAEYVYDLRGDGQKRPPTQVEIAILLRDSEDMRDFGTNPTKSLRAWIYSWTYCAQEGQCVNYGKVPLLTAKFTASHTRRILSVVSSVGYATGYTIKNLTTGVTTELSVPIGTSTVSFDFGPGVYHIIPLGIDVTIDWWLIEQYLNNGGGAGGATTPVPSTP